MKRKKKSIVRFQTLFVIISGLLIVSCDPGEPQPTFCLLNPQDLSARCVETGDGGKDYDESLLELKGWVATSSDDFAEMKKYYEKIKRDLKECQGD